MKNIRGVNPQFFFNIHLFHHTLYYLLRVFEQSGWRGAFFLRSCVLLKQHLGVDRCGDRMGKIVNKASYGEIQI
jgi:hypothetical protein